MVQYDFEKRIKLREFGEKLPSTEKWNNIKVGGIYHLPPLLESKRKDIKVLSKSTYFIRIQDIHDKDQKTGYIYNYDIESNYLIPINN